MNDRPREDEPRDDEQSASDWLAAKSGEQSGEQETDSSSPVVPAPPVAAVPPAAPAPPTPLPASAGAFSWGLRPGVVEPVEDVPAPGVPSDPAPVPPAVPPAATPAPESTVPPVESAPLPPPPLTETAPLEPAPLETAPLETARLPEAVPTAPTAPVTGDWDQPTQLIDAQPPAASATPAPLSPEATTELLVGAEAAEAEEAENTTSALDTLFGEDNFRDYDVEPAPVRVSTGPRVETPDAVGPHEGIGRAQQILLGVAGGFVLLLALVALFLLGTRLPALIGPDPTPTPSVTPSPTPSPTPTVLPVGPVAPGVWAWDELLGGECLDPFVDPWAEEFTVVDCANPHPAQLVYRGTFPAAEGDTDPSDDAFPGTQALQGQLSLLCTASGVVDLAAAGQYADVQLQGSYPATQEQWDAGDRTYYCFASRASGEPLTGSLAVPQASAVASPEG
ncbi:MAG: septum formation family protein [Protaetiibacter sp.]